MDANGRSETVVLTAERIEQLLADFRDWLVQATHEPIPDVTPPEQEVDLFTLVAQFTALRHEVHLQTKATRQAIEQNQEMLRQLTQTYDLLRSSTESLRQARDTIDDHRFEQAISPLLRGLIDAYDALILASREVEKLTQTLPTLLQELAPATLPPLPSLSAWNEPTFVRRPTPEQAPGSSATAAASQGATSQDAASQNTAGRSWFGWLRGRRSATPWTAASAPALEAEPLLALWQERWLALDAQRQALQADHVRLLAWQQAVRDTQDANMQRWQNLGERLNKILTGLSTGYQMSLQRLDKLLPLVDLQPIDALGRPYQPETMEVLEAVEQSGRPSHEVLEVVRRGYWRKGKLFRTALVRVAK